MAAIGPLRRSCAWQTLCGRSLKLRVPQAWPTRVCRSSCRRHFADLVPQEATESGVPAVAIQMHKVSVYISKDDVEETARGAYRYCQLGAALGLTGIAGMAMAIFVVSSSPQVLGALAVVAGVKSYRDLVLPRRNFAKTASRHVEQLWVLQADPDFSALAPEVHLEVLTTNLAIQITLSDRAPLEGSRYQGLLGDGRTLFGDAVQNSNFLYFDLPREAVQADEASEDEMPVESQDSDDTDVALLQQLLRAGKVVTRHSVVARQGIQSSLLKPNDKVVKEMEEVLSELTKKLSAGAKNKVALRPVHEMRRDGILSMFSGVLVLGGAFVFGLPALSRPRQAAPSTDGKESDWRDIFKAVQLRVDKP